MISNSRMFSSIPRPSSTTEQGSLVRVRCWNCVARVRSQSEAGPQEVTEAGAPRGRPLPEIPPNVDRKRHHYLGFCSPLPGNPTGLTTQKPGDKGVCEMQRTGLRANQELASSLSIPPARCMLTNGAKGVPLGSVVPQSLFHICLHISSRYLCPSLSSHPPVPRETSLWNARTL